MKKKFKDDLTAARSARPNLRGFVFFTNVDVTPTEEAELQQHGLAQGLTYVSIINRELMRQYLDGQTGLSVRYQYLHITMSDVEQKVFFQTYGARLEDIILNRFGYVEQKLERLEFIQDAAEPFNKMGMILFFDKRVAVQELSNCAVRINIYVDLRHWSKDYGNDDARMLWIATKTRTPYPERPNFIVFDNFLWTTTCDGKNITSVTHAAAYDWGEQPTVEVVELFSYHVRDRLPFATISELSWRPITTDVTKSLLGKLSNIWLVVGDYVVCKIGVDPDPPTTEEEFRDFVKRTGRPHSASSRALADLAGDTLRDPWPDEDRPRNWIALSNDEINFDNYRPERLDKYRAVEQPDEEGT
jgi:hypothetical protein